MIRKSFLLAVAAAVFAATAGFAPASYAGVSCSTDTAAEVAAATVTNRGYNWSSAAQPNPLWTVNIPDLNMSVDLYAADDAGARAAAKAILDGEQASACQAATASTSSASTSSSASSASYDQATVDAATALAQGATVTYRGYAWSSASQPLPLWTVSLPSMNMSVDVYAADEAGARQAAVATIEASLASGNQPTAAATASAPPTSTSTSSGASAPASTSAATTSATAPVTGGDLRNARQNPDQGSANPLLAGVLRSAFGHPVTIQNSTVCVVGPRVVPCSQVFVTLGSGSQIQVTVSGGAATRIAVRPHH